MSNNAIKRRPAKVYVAGPITSSGNLTENVREGIRIGNCLLSQGVIPFVPHLSELWNYVSVVSWDQWLFYDKEWIRACDALLRLSGKSKGAAREVRFANKLGIPVFYSYAKLMKWINEKFMTGPTSIIKKVTRPSPSKPKGKSRSSSGKPTKKKGRR